MLEQIRWSLNESDERVEEVVDRWQSRSSLSLNMCLLMSSYSSRYLKWLVEVEEVSQLSSHLSPSFPSLQLLERTRDQSRMSLVPLDSNMVGSTILSMVSAC